MKVALIARKTLFTVEGGDTIQITQTARHLCALGIVADIRLTNEVISYEQYDLLHFFNIIRPADIHHHINKSNKPFALSPILVDYRDFDQNYRTGPSAVLLKHLPAGLTEYAKTIGRFLAGRDGIASLSFLWKGQRTMMTNILRRASLIFCSSTLEKKSLEVQFGIKAGEEIISNGIDPVQFKFDPKITKDDKLVICAARIEGLKNQLNLIRALSNTPYRLLIIGAPAPGHMGYYNKCCKEAGTNVEFVGKVDQKSLANYFQQAKVHVLPSFFETCGLASLESAAMGCNIVVTEKGYAREYFGDEAFYCDPANPVSILAAVDSASRCEMSDRLRQRILTSYTWSSASDKIAAAYQLI